MGPVVLVRAVRGAARKRNEKKKRKEAGKKDGQEEEFRKEEGPKGSLQCLLSVHSDANPGVQGSSQHDRPKQRWLHQSGRSWWYVLVDGKGPPSGLLGSHDQRSVS